MKKKYILLSIPALLLLLWLGWYFSDKQIIKRQLTELTQNLTKEKDEPTLETGLKLREVKQMLASEIDALIPERNYSQTHQRDMIIRYLMYYRDRYDTLTVSFESLLIELPAKGEAAVAATVLMRRKGPQNGLEELSGPVEFLLKKDKEEKAGRKWKLVQGTVPATFIE